MKVTATTPAKLIRKDYNERDWRNYRWIYCRLTERVDAQIGRLLDADDIAYRVQDRGGIEAAGWCLVCDIVEESAQVPPRFGCRQCEVLHAIVVSAQ